jgi:serine/threonine-protein kinase
MAGNELIQQLRQRKLVQWALAYAAAAFALVQGVDMVAQRFGWSDSISRGLIIIAFIGFLVTLLLAWYHGERGAQKVSGTELLILALLLAVGGGLLWKFAPVSPAQTAPATTTAVPASDQGTKAADNSIAVLPFIDLSQAHDQEYFSDGLSEELLNLLGQVPQLRVIARTSSFSFKDKEVDAATIARQLNVEYLLEGSVRKSGNTVRITAQLIRASDSSRLWSQTFDRELIDVFKVQDEIAAAVVEALKLQLLAGQAIAVADRSRNPEAYNDYLLGKELYNRQNTESHRRAAEAFRRAIAEDPAYGAPRAGLALAEYYLADVAGDRASKQRALKTADDAVAAAPQLADAYAARGVIRLSFLRDWAGARSDFDRALALNRASPVALIGKFRLLIALGQTAEAEQAARANTEVDPLSVEAWNSLGRALYAQGRRDEARVALQRAEVLGPDASAVGFAQGMNALMDGDAAMALAAFKRSRSVYRPAGIAMAEYSLGHARESQQALDQAIAENAQGGPYQIAQAFAWRGQTDQAFAWLDRAVEYNDGGLTFIKSDPMLMQRLGGDPRYAALLAKIGLPP